MAIDYAEKEREFIDSLAQDTGRDLDGWMRTIADQNIAERNALIDWLRRQGFTFAKASWLERIHHNGGRLIYASNAASERPRQFPRMTAVPPMPQETAAKPVFTPRIVHTTPSLVLVETPAPVRDAPPALDLDRDAADVEMPRAPVDQRKSPSSLPAPLQTPFPAPLQAGPPPSSSAEIDALLAGAKAYRPLAQVIVQEVVALVPGAALSAAPPFVLFATARTFAALLPSPKGLKLYLDLDGHFFSTPKPADAGGAKARKPAFSHMIVLADAREIDEGLRAAIQYAHAQAQR